MDALRALPEAVANAVREQTPQPPAPPANQPPANQPPATPPANQPPATEPAARKSFGDWWYGR
jgi:hypothetical protein